MFKNLSRGVSGWEPLTPWHGAHGTGRGVRGQGASRPWSGVTGFQGASDTSNLKWILKPGSF